MVRKDYAQLRRSDGALPDVCHPFRYELAADQNLGVRDAGGTRSRLPLELLADDVVAAGEHALRGPCVDPETRVAFIRPETFTGPKRLAPRLEPEDVREQVIPSHGEPCGQPRNSPLEDRLDRDHHRVKWRQNGHPDKETFDPVHRQQARRQQRPDTPHQMALPVARQSSPAHAAPRQLRRQLRREDVAA
jgi:hypothetical protein